MRASPPSPPSQSGQLTIAGFSISYALYGDSSARPVLLLPTWQIVHSRIWKMQIPYLARACRVITFDPPGNGGGERTTDPTAFEYNRIVDQAAGLLDFLDLRQADVAGLSRGGAYGLLMAARYPERVNRLVLIGSVVTATGWPLPPDPGFWTPREAYAGWEKSNAHYWRIDYPGWLDFFLNQVFNEPHSTKPIDDAIQWGLETTPEILIQTCQAPLGEPSLTAEGMLARVRCPVLLIHGEGDQIMSMAAARSLAAARPDWEFVALAGCGHNPNVRDPVRVNQLIAEFLGIQ